MLEEEVLMIMDEEEVLMDDGSDVSTFGMRGVEERPAQARQTVSKHKRQYDTSTDSFQMQRIKYHGSSDQECTTCIYMYSNAGWNWPWGAQARNQSELY